MNRLFVYILFFLLSTTIQAQQDSLVVSYDRDSSVEIKKFDKDKLAEYSADDDFDYTIVKQQEGFFGMIWSWIKRLLRKVLSWFFGVESAAGILLVVLRIIPYLILLIVLILTIKYFLKVKTNSIISGRSEKAKVFITEDEEIISNKNISDLIAKAVAQNNYRLAVRYYYLLVLQKLQEKEMIVYEQQKTNEDYIKEINEQNITLKFSDLTRLYDFVWYGNFEINEVEFAKVESNFNMLTAELE
ncbi:MAG: DUF4129 domain-containing protein [Flavobacteriaceae bacterium]|nr:MAG: DUF4129 domain-containing protein [Flavobacteriaceae bacterium]